MLTGRIFDLRRFSIHDGPGIRTTVFFQGCPLKCKWCHNPEGRSGKAELMLRPARCIGCGACEETCPQGAITRPNGAVRIDRELCDRCGLCAEACYAEALNLAGYRVTALELACQIERDRIFYEQSGGGVTFSGGEPLLQAGFLSEVLEACKQKHIHTAVDTCGYAPWSAFEAVEANTDLFLFDLKLMDEELHRRYTGVSNQRILENLARLSGAGHRIVVRIPLIPGVNDDEGNLGRAGAYLGGLPALEYVELLAYHTIGAEKYAGLGQRYELEGLKPPAEEQMLAAVRRLEEYGLKVRYGGN